MITKERVFELRQNPLYAKLFKLIKLNYPATNDIPKSLEAFIKYDTSLPFDFIERYTDYLNWETNIKSFGIIERVIDANPDITDYNILKIIAGIYLDPTFTDLLSMQSWTKESVIDHDIIPTVYNIKIVESPGEELNGIPGKIMNLVIDKIPLDDCSRSTLSITRCVDSSLNYIDGVNVDSLASEFIEFDLGNKISLRTIGELYKNAQVIDSIELKFGIDQTEYSDILRNIIVPEVRSVVMSPDLVAMLTSSKTFTSNLNPTASSSRYGKVGSIYGINVYRDIYADESYILRIKGSMKQTKPIVVVGSIYDGKTVELPTLNRSEIDGIISYTLDVPFITYNETVTADLIKVKVDMFDLPTLDFLRNGKVELMVETRLNPY